MKTKIFLNSLLAVIIGLALFIPGTFAATFGVSPPWIVNENLKPGSNFVYVIDLSTNNPYQDMVVKTKIGGDPEITKWLTIRNQEKLVMPKGKEHVPMYVDVKVPKDAKVGKYKGDIMITVIPKANNSENISIYLGGRIAIKFEVVNYDVMDYMVKSINVEPITEGQPLSLNLKLKNLGNVPVSSIKTNVKVTDYKTGKAVATGSADKLTKPIYPQTMGEAKLTVPITDISAGKYWVNVDATENGKSIYQNRLYLTINSPDINNVLRTSVRVGTKKELKAAATTTTPVLKKKNSVSVKTAVTVKAPMTNKLIGVVIILLGILIIITVKLNLHCYIKRRR